MNRVYYAHSMKIYNTEREHEELIRLQEFFQDMDIYNPNQDEIQNHTNPMAKCLHIVKDKETQIIAFSHRARRIPSGVYAEILAAQKCGKPIYIINPESIDRYSGRMKMTKRDRATDWARV